ncbi:MAG TPA: hypothetical protein VKP59_04260 [Candidatus Thermoplasmatota archaeon]|nr:hypothetical protein [Candidatus Thermoplasmatota archaeon]
MNSESTSKYIGFGLILGAALGTLIGIYTYQKPYFLLLEPDWDWD